MTPRAISPPPRGWIHSRGLSAVPKTDDGPDTGKCPNPEGRGNPALESGGQRFPFNNFTYCLTLFPKCFSSFDHSTCALSVSGQYLALDEIYHPF